MKTGFIDDEDQKAVSKSIRDRVALVKRLREMKREDGKEVTSSQEVPIATITQEVGAEVKENVPEKEPTVVEKETKQEEETVPLQPVSRQNSNEPKNALDVIQRIESVSNSGSPTMGNSPHTTLDERVFQDAEKVMFLCCPCTAIF